MKIPNVGVDTSADGISLARIVSEDSQHSAPEMGFSLKSSKDS